MKVGRLICMLAAHEYRMVRPAEGDSTEGWVVRCERCGRRTDLPRSSVQAGRYTWDFGPD